MPVLSGKSGTLKLDGAVVAPIGNWKLLLTAHYKTYAATDTHGAVTRIAGPDDCSGSFDCKVTDDGHCPVARGQEVVAQLHVDGSGNNYYEAPVVVERIAVECDILTGEVVAFAVEFLGSGPVATHGVLTKSN